MAPSTFQPRRPRGGRPNHESLPLELVQEASKRREVLDSPYDPFIVSMLSAKTRT